MASNFDFLKSVDDELFSDIEDAQKLFRDEYFNQSMVQIRVFAEKMAKKLAKSTIFKDTPNIILNMTFDDILNCLKDKAKSEREKEFIEDLFFIKKEGNKCAHGEDSAPSLVLEGLRRAFEAGINYACALDKNSKASKLNFDETLLITGKPLKDNNLVQKYVELAQQKSEEIEQEKEKEQPKKTKPLNPKKLKIKEKIKQTKKELRENINKTPKKLQKKPSNKSKKSQKKFNLLKHAAFWIFVTISLFLLKLLIF